MSAEASGSSGGNVVTVSGSAASSSSHVGEEKACRSLAGSKYVKLNVGGTLHYTTVQTLTKEDSLLRSICDGSTEVTIDSEGKKKHENVLLYTTFQKFGIGKIWSHHYRVITWRNWTKLHPEGLWKCLQDTWNKVTW